MSIINNGLLLASGADAATTYQISRSLRFNSADSAHLSRNCSAPSSSWTLSLWVKRSKLSTYQYFFAPQMSGSNVGLVFNNDDRLRWYDTDGTNNYNYYSTAVFRDVSAWYHIVMRVSAGAFTIYVNNVSHITGNLYAGLQSGNWYLGCIYSGSPIYFTDAYFADIYFIDGSAKVPGDFAETDATTGQWIPKTYSGSYGTTGFRLSLSDNSGTTSTTLGKDAAGSNNWTPNNFSVASGSGNDSLVDTPTSFGSDTGVGGEVRGNYATWNPLALVYNTPSLSNGNLDSANNNSVCVSTIGIPPTGKWYCEVSGTGMTGGICPIPRTTQIEYNIGNGVTGVIGIAVNRDADEVKLYKDNVLQSTTSISGAGISTSTTVFIQSYAGGTLNAGQRAFAYTAPSGFKALCDTNLPAPVVAKPSTVMDVKLYTGNGSTQTISGLGFSPDLVWIKGRSVATNNALYDLVRGANKRLMSNATDAEISATQDLTAFNSDGFTLGTDGTVNGNSNTYVGWCWDGGTSTVTNTQGSITSSVRANASAGFSIVSYTGTGTSPVSVGHGLNVAPTFLIFKDRDTAVNWQVWTTAVNSNGTVFEGLNNTAAGTTPWTYISATSSLIQFNSGNSSQTSNGKKFICYAWAPVAGYSSFGSYTGNGSTDGPFVYTGHRSRFVLIKRTDAADNWVILDTARNTYNSLGEYLLPNTSDGGGSTTLLDINSNGFKLRFNGTTLNASGGTYLFVALAESPFQYARAR